MSLPAGSSSGDQAEGLRPRCSARAVRGTWTEAEDATLRRLIGLHGKGDWHALAAHMPGRVGKQLRERWCNQLAPGINKGPWTQAEDMQLIEAHAEVGNLWATIAKQLPGRTENLVKNHWHAMRRKVQQGSADASPLWAYIKNEEKDACSGLGKRDSYASSCSEQEECPSGLGLKRRQAQRRGSAATPADSASVDSSSSHADLTSHIPAPSLPAEAMPVQCSPQIGLQTPEQELCCMNTITSKSAATRLEWPCSNSDEEHELVMQMMAFELLNGSMLQVDTAPPSPCMSADCSEPLSLLCHSQLTSPSGSSSLEDIAQAEERDLYAFAELLPASLDFSLGNEAAADLALSKLYATGACGQHPMPAPAGVSNQTPVSSQVLCTGSGARTCRSGPFATQKAGSDGSSALYVVSGNSRIDVQPSLDICIGEECQEPTLTPTNFIEVATGPLQDMQAYKTLIRSNGMVVSIHSGTLPISSGCSMLDQSQVGAELKNICDIIRVKSSQAHSSELGDLVVALRMTRPAATEELMLLIASAAAHDSQAAEAVSEALRLIRDLAL